MMNDNWHRRFGKMWWCIIIILFITLLESYCRVDVQYNLRKEIENLKIEQVFMKENIRLESDEIDSLDSNAVWKNDVMKSCFRDKFIRSLPVKIKE